MAMKLYERYPGCFSPATSSYPQGAFKNRSAPGAKDGSYLEKDWANDKEGFFGSLLRSAGLTPNGTPDTALASQYFDALKFLLDKKISGDNCTDAGLTAGGTLPYMRKTDGSVFYLASRVNTFLEGNTSVPDSPAGSADERIANTRFVSSAISASVIANPPIGVNQSWQDMTASRAKGVTYTNNTGRPIELFIAFDPNGSLSVLTITGHPFSVADNNGVFVSMIIPAGGTYSLSDWGIASAMKWLELR